MCEALPCCPRFVPLKLRVVPARRERFEMVRSAEKKLEVLTPELAVTLIVFAPETETMDPRVSVAAVLLRPVSEMVLERR